MIKRNCKICSEYRAEEIGDSDFGAVYSDTLTCAADKDLDPETEEYIKNFDYETEKDCCIPEFWYVVDVDTEVKAIYEKEMETKEGADFPKRAYEKFKEKYFIN